MANEKQTIRVLTEPTIILDDMQGMDVEDGTSTVGGSPTSPVSYSKQYGAVFPVVQVNQTMFPTEQVTALRINSVGEIPFVSVTILVKDKSFYSTSFPKDGDLVSVFIRSRDDAFKPIRNDYEITNVNVNSAIGSGEDGYDTMTISGKLWIPGYDAVKTFSKKGTSMRALMETATDLNLGFATNEVDTADEQVWLCPSDKTSSFIYQTAMSSWKDDNSFFSYFIDYYYYFNFVNMEPLFAELPEIDEALSLDLLTNDYGKDSVQGKSKTRLVLTDWDEVGGTPMHITSYALFNNSAAINSTYGYKSYANYYDALIRESQSIYVDPKTTEGAERDMVLLKGRPGENFYLQQVESKWMGSQYGESGENCHGKYLYSRLNNFQNNVHLEKMGLRLTLAGFNVNLRRMMTVPVVIVIKKDFVRKRINEPADQDQQTVPTGEDGTKSALSFEETPITLDKTISGYYVISDMAIVYENGKFRHDCTLLRREWPAPPNIY